MKLRSDITKHELVYGPPVRPAFPKQPGWEITRTLIAMWGYEWDYNHCAEASLHRELQVTAPQVLE